MRFMTINELRRSFLCLTRLIITASGIFMFNNCSQKSTKDERSDEIVLKIGKLEITKYEFEKEKNLIEHSNLNTKLWLNEYIDNAYLVADGYAKGYDTIEFINKIVDNRPMIQL